ncbi:Glycine/sarcosine/dimethylglycine N-methyltransferase [Streptomyces alboniger]
MEPEYVDEGLCRMRYQFPDDSVYHLNMFPLRKEYTRKLMTDVGFQRVETYGDFQHTYRGEQPDFFVHVAEKEYRTEDADVRYTGAVGTARSYYNSPDADTFYAKVWGGEDIHIGPLRAPGRTDRGREPPHGAADGGRAAADRGFGGPRPRGGLRRLRPSAGRGHGCRVIALNLSEVENRRHKELNAGRGLSDRIDVVDGSFEDIPYGDREPTSSGPRTPSCTAGTASRSWRRSPWSSAPAAT